MKHDRMSNLKLFFFYSWRWRQQAPPNTGTNLPTNQPTRQHSVTTHKTVTLLVSAKWN